jgi:ElaB/YqjD/DUF883 family membrane-anchored ribosome-binding protein
MESIMIDTPNAVAPEDLKDKAYRLRDQVGQTASLAKDVACDGLKSAKDQAAALCQAASDKAVQLKDSSVEFVQENPIKTVLLAVGVGAVVGMLLARRL